MIIVESQDGLQLVPPEPFLNEAKLQSLIEEYPQLVFGTDEDAFTTAAIWTIGREVKLRSGSLDLLLIDSTGRVWVVETKLEHNQESRKQVVGQVLGYTADIAEWTAGDLETQADTYLAANTNGSADLISFRDLVAGTSTGNGSLDPDEILANAERRLRRGDLTALVVVDSIPEILRRLVSFVNRNAQFELLALAVRVHRMEDRRILVPTLVGSSGQSKQASHATWAAEQFFHTLEQKCPEAVDPARQLYDWGISDPRLTVDFGIGGTKGSMLIKGRRDGTRVSVASIWTDGVFGPTHAYSPTFRGADWWKKYRKFLARVSETEQPPESGRSFPLSKLLDHVDELKGIISDIID